MSSFGPPTPRFESSAEHLVQFCTENMFFFDFVDFAVLARCMYVWEKCCKCVVCVVGCFSTRKFPILALQRLVLSARFECSFWVLCRALSAILHRNPPFFCDFVDFVVLVRCMYVWEKCFKCVVGLLEGACDAFWVKNFKFWLSNGLLQVLV